ncbi:MAG: DNA polymerase beta superfamily protein [Imperialibacter sp.]|uniref:nucleotidyltransferase domain-containing protein n=1 Tax=Imperialibacter sp. TaxID=2038411 RepID=UPI003A8A7DA9
MEDLIRKKLTQIEQDYNIKVLYACESGSRAWGFPSPNSDYDVRFIYAHSLDWHLSLTDKKDTIDLPINDELDIGGWEIKKALQLLWKSNAPILEWIQSPIVYQADLTFLSGIREVAAQCFSPIATMHHYLSMSKKYLEACSSEEVKLKKYFYALRTAIAGAWIREKGSVPHIEITKMLSVAGEEVRDKIISLIELKATQKEDYLHPQEPVILHFLRDVIEQNETAFPSLSPGKGDFDKLEEFYRKTVKAE